MCSVYAIISYYQCSDLCFTSRITIGFSRSAAHKVLISFLTKTFAPMSRHLLAFFLTRCLWDGMPCGKDNFTRVLTDYGVCYTFNSGTETDGFVHYATHSGKSTSKHVNRRKNVLTPVLHVHMAIYGSRCVGKYV